MTVSVGFIGLGIMGAPMARNIIKAGFALTVHNRTRAKEEPLAALGAKRAASPQEVAEQSTIIITVVGDSGDVEAVITGDDGVLAGAKAGSIVIDMSTISPTVTRRIAAAGEHHGVKMLDCPVSGGEQGAIDGTLSIMAGGAAEDLERARPVLAAMSKKITHIGGSGTGQMTKLCNQVVVGLTLLAAAEGLALAETSGLDAQKVFTALSEGAARSWLLESLGPKMLSRDFAPGFMVRHLRKDIRLAIEMADALDQPVFGTAIVRELLNATEAAGHGSDGTQALICAIERAASKDGGHV